jgi:hypothetical protein
MKKLANLLTLAFGASLATAAMAGGPADKATGSVEIGLESPGVYLVFNAHEAKDDRPAKGEVYTLMSTAESAGAYSQWRVNCVTVEAPAAGFVAELALTTDPNMQVGQKIWIKVTDLATPGSQGDLVAVQAVDEELAASLCAAPATLLGSPELELPVLSGNLVVHAK